MVSTMSDGWRFEQVWKVQESGKEFPFGKKIVNTLQSPGKAPTLFENMGSSCGVVMLAVSYPCSRGLENIV